MAFLELARIIEVDIFYGSQLDSKRRDLSLGHVDFEIVRNLIDELRYE